MGAGLILWVLLGVTTAVVAAQLIGELVVNALFFDLVNPYYGKIGGDFQILQNAAIAIVVLSAVAFAVFVAAAVLYFVLHLDIAKWIAIGGAAVDLGVFICAIILYAKVSKGYGKQGMVFAGFYRILGDDEYYKFWVQIGDKAKDAVEPDNVRTLYNRLFPEDAWLAFLIISIVALLLIVAIIVLTLVLKIEGIAEVFPAHTPVSGAGPPPV
jgi:hypothetical protein